MPHEESGGRYLYDRDACERWARANRRAKTHGGTRQGAGRKPSRVPPDRRLTRAVDIADARKRARERQAEFVHVDDLLQIEYRELLVLVGLEIDETGLDKAKLERLKLLQEARARYRDEEEKLGRLVNAEEAAAAFAARLVPIRERLDRVPARLLRAVCAALHIDRGDEAAALAAMTAEVDAIVREIGEEA